MYKSIMAISLFFLLSQPLVSYGGLGITIERCSDDQLGVKPAKKRHAWGMNCLPGYMNDVETLKQLSFDDDKINPTDPETGKRKSIDEMPFKVYVPNEDGSDARDPEFGYPGLHFMDKYGERNAVWKPNLTTCSMPEDVQYTRVCPAGCYTGNQYILFSKGYLPIADIDSDSEKGLITLTQNSTLNNIQLREGKLFKVIKDSELVEQTFIKIITNKGSLTVTPNHPLLKANGYMVKAKELKLRDKLLTSDGVAASIIDYDIFKDKAYAYNVISASHSNKEKIVVAQGFLSGDLYYQNAGAKYLNKLIIRSGKLIPQEAL